MKLIRISGKNLGYRDHPDHCPRCFSIRLKLHDWLPFQIFPGIFSSIDTYSKKITNTHFQRHGKVPPWLEQFTGLGEPLKAFHHSVFQSLDTERNILLTGIPDEVLRRPDGTLLILDYKTARCSDAQDAMLPVYQTQLNSYGWIAQRIGLGTVTGLGLVYYEPCTEVEESTIDSVVVDDGLVMKFKAKWVPIPLETERIPWKLEWIRATYDLPIPSSGKPGCKDCALLTRLVEIAGASAQP